MWVTIRTVKRARNRFPSILLPLPHIYARHVRIFGGLEPCRAIGFAVGDFQRVAVEFVDAPAEHVLAVAAEGEVHRFGLFDGVDLERAFHGLLIDDAAPREVVAGKHHLLPMTRLQDGVDVFLTQFLAFERAADADPNALELVAFFLDGLLVRLLRLGRGRVARAEVLRSPGASPPGGWAAPPPAPPPRAPPRRGSGFV